MRLRKLIKEFRFSNKERSVTTLGTNVRIDPARSLLTLKQDANGDFSTNPDVEQTARTRVTNPQSVKRWIGFQVDVVNKVNKSNQVVTSVGFRLNNGGLGDLWWDGAAWTDPGVGDWNTEAEVATNIAALPVIASKAFQVVLKLQTTDSKLAPEVTRIKALYESDLEWEEEYLARSIIPAMREEIRPIAEYSVKALKNNYSSVDLAESNLGTPYQLVEVDAIYNLTTDPAKLTNILDAYDPTTRVATLSAPAGAGDVILVRFVYVPEIVIARDQDFTELAKVPAIVVESIEYGESYIVGEAEYVIDKTTFEGWQLPPGSQRDINFTVRWITDKQKDADRLAGEVAKFFEDRLIRARGQDEMFSLCATDVRSVQVSSKQSGLHDGRLRARLYRAIFYWQPAQPVHAVQRMLAQGDVNFQVS